MRRLRFVTAAANDLADIRGFIRKQIPAAAVAMMKRFRNIFQLLLRNPGMGELRIYLPHDGIRSFSVGNYVVYFRQLPEFVELLRIIHGAQQTPSFD
jgi:toxin ParE1/3/4